MKRLQIIFIVSIEAFKTHRDQISQFGHTYQSKLKKRRVQIFSTRCCLLKYFIFKHESQNPIMKSTHFKLIFYSQFVLKIGNYNVYFQQTFMPASIDNTHSDIFRIFRVDPGKISCPTLINSWT